MDKGIKWIRVWWKISVATLIIIVALILGYLLFVSFPELAFPHKMQKANIQVYSTKPVSNNLPSLLDSVYHRIRFSDLFREQEDYKVFLCNDVVFSIVAFFHPYAAGLNSSLLNGKSFIRPADISSNTLIGREGEPIPGKRDLIGSIAHEITHKMIVDHFGKRLLLKMDHWVVEGYADYIGKIPIDFEQNKHHLMSGSMNLNRYDLYQTLTHFFLEEKELTLSDYFQLEYSEFEALEILKNSY